MGELGVHDVSAAPPPARHAHDKGSKHQLRPPAAQQRAACSRVPSNRQQRWRARDERAAQHLPQTPHPHPLPPRRAPARSHTARRSYTSYGIGAIMAYFIVNGPDNTLQTWARPIAQKEVDEEDEIFAAYAAVRAVCVFVCVYVCVCLCVCARVCVRIVIVLHSSNGCATQRPASGSRHPPPTPPPGPRAAGGKGGDAAAVQQAPRQVRAMQHLPRRTQALARTASAKNTASRPPGVRASAHVCPPPPSLRAPDRYYDAVMMRHEYDVLMTKHAAAKGGSS